MAATQPRRIKKYHRWSWIFMVLEAVVSVPYVIREFTRTKLPDWRVGRFPS